MLPKWHILFGAIFSMAAYLFGVSLFYSLIIFISSVLIDTDHYFWYLQRKNDFSLKRSYEWYKSQPKIHKPVMHVFHTAEFLLIIFILSFYFKPLVFVSLGFLFHSLVDIIEMILHNRFYCREFSFIRYLIKRNEKGRYL